MNTIAAIVPTTLGVLYTVRAGNVLTLRSIHVSNESGVTRTFTFYIRAEDGTLCAISKLEQELLADSISIYGDEIRVTSECTIEAVASGSDVKCLITGREVSLVKDLQQYARS